MSSLKKRGQWIAREFGYLPNKEARQWAMRYSHWAASGIGAWLDQLCPDLTPEQRKNTMRRMNASIWAARHDAMRYSAYGALTGLETEDPTESLVEDIDRRAKGEHESYGTNQPVEIGSKVVVAIDRHLYQGFVGTVLSKRPDNRYHVQIHTEIHTVNGFFAKDELISLRSYIRSRSNATPIPNSYCLGRGVSGDADVDLA